MKTLLADPSVLKLQKISCFVDRIEILVAANQAQALCPSCQQPSDKRHSRYQRILADLPWQGIPVHLRLLARKFFCVNPNCSKRVFCERLPKVASRYARQTQRLHHALQLLGVALGGRAGSRTSQRLGFFASRDTLLRRVRQAALPTPSAPRILGVDDWAIRKGHRYGSILVDLERRCVIDLLADRESSSLETWLKAYPSIEVVTRDRALSYAEGAQRGAPQAQQVADRFHLLKNLAEALERLLHRHHASLSQAAKSVDVLSPVKGELPPATLSKPSSWKEKVRQEQEHRRERRLQRYEEVLRLYKQGNSLRAIARQTGMSRVTLRRFVKAGSFPERAPSSQRKTKLSGYSTYLRERWEAGCHNATQLWREIHEQGFAGRAAVVRYHLRDGEVPPSEKAQSSWHKLKTPSPRQAVWWLLKATGEGKPEQQALLDQLLQMAPEIKVGRELAQEFQRLVRNRQTERFDDWRGKVANSGLTELKNFSEGLMRDEAAVRAALQSEWSNGQAEGQINRLKMIKRTMYGRANLDLLRARVLLWK